MIRAVGLDIGSSWTKAVLLEGDVQVRIVAVQSMPDMVEAAAMALVEVGAGNAPVLATGYGRALHEARLSQVSEITALAAGIARVLPHVRTVVDIGGQDAKVVRIEGGRVADFAMNDRCAAGTGRFLEVMSRVLGIPFDEFDARATADVSPLPVTSTCTVFAESEVIGLLSRKEPPAAILKGVMVSISDRVASMARQVGLEPPIAVSGGAVRSRALVAALSRALGYPVEVPPEPQTVTALGAAILCKARLESGT
jgi:predicted CoA-substrate-specific enzyme activase